MENKLKDLWNGFIMEDKIKDLLDKIALLPYHKRITISSSLSEKFTMELNESGDNAESIHLLKSKLISEMTNRRGIIVMMIFQYLPSYIKRTTQNGQEEQHQEKNVYGVLLANGKWVSIIEQDLKNVCKTNPITGQSEEAIGTHFKVLP